MIDSWWWSGPSHLDRQRLAGQGDAQSLPGNSGFPLSISASTQPTLHMSIARVYSLNVNITSGARYHLAVVIVRHGRHQKRTRYLVATYSVMKVLLSLAKLGGGVADRAKPKSHSCYFVKRSDATAG